jgi:hypothetical protein
VSKIIRMFFVRKYRAAERISREMRNGFSASTNHWFVRGIQLLAGKFCPQRVKEVFLLRNKVFT